ncbi:MAG: ribonuclease H-like domain-containing protein, partial [Candidatus Acidiferrales bacterium]
STGESKYSHLKALRPAARRLAKMERGESADMPAGAERLAMILGASSCRNRCGEHLVLKRWFPEPSVCEPHAHVIRLLVPDAHKSAFDPDQWLFLDTETTGLSGGTGTYPFLIGVAWWDAGGLQVEQFFMRDYHEEQSVLIALQERLAERRVLVTFNGKSFDWPLLETRYHMSRTIVPRAPLVHLDLLHPARNLWRLRLGSVRLVELERHVLGLDRGPDVMSELIPSMYFEYVRGGSPDPLVPIFRHNQMDLCGLAMLAEKMFSLLASPEDSGGDAFELYGVSRILERRGDRKRARGLCARAVESGLPDAVDRTARHGLALLAKRERDYPAASALWESLCGDSLEGLDSYEQLAIYYEHHARQPLQALRLAREALDALQELLRIGQKDSTKLRKMQTRLEHRLARLTRKLSARKEGELIHQKSTKRIESELPPLHPK